jgi:hypothetical protein
MLDDAEEDIAAAGAPVGPRSSWAWATTRCGRRTAPTSTTGARKFDREADSLIATLRRLGATKIVWATLREPSEDIIPPEGREQYRLYIWYFPYVNERLRLIPERHPDVILADWAAVSNQSGLTYDAMHLTRSGIRLMIDTIRTAGGI